MKKIINNTIQFLPYLLLVAPAIVLSNQQNLLPPLIKNNIEILVYSIFFISFAVALKFKRSRSFFILIIAVSSFAVFTQNEFIEKKIHFFGNYSKIFLSLIIPVNIVLFTFFKERGFFTLKGAGRMIFIFLQFLCLFAIAYYEQTMFIDKFYADIIPAGMTVYIALSDASLIITLISLFVLLAVTIHKKSHIDISFFISIALMQTAVNFSDNSVIMSLFFISSALVIGFSILSESYHLAYIDELTNIPARRALLEHMAKLGRKYTIAMIDIDHFKKFNDTHGHDVGDDVLKIVASGLCKTTGGAKVYRYGGEEFTVVFPGKTAEESVPHLEGIREIISKTPYKLKKKNSKSDKTLYVTVSIGAAQKSQKTKTPQEVLKLADNALYKAKKSGRNRVCI